MKKLVYKISGLALLAGSMVVGWLLMEYQQFANSPLQVSEQGFHYELKNGATLKKVARELAAAQVIEKPRYLVWMARLAGNANRIQAGEYLFTNTMTANHLLEKITKGETVQYAFTIIEGWSFEQMLQEMHKNEHLTHTLKGLSSKQIMNKLGLPGEHPEGRFLPDTYHFPRGTTDLAFLERAYQAQEQYLQQAWAGRAEGLPYKKPYEALIMASIVEKETGVPEERPEIAGVFVRRLQKRMRLQTDPTVIYGLGKAYKGNIKRRHLKQDTPYNTYTRHGLPPTPIALAGREAIDAALHPKAGESLYFVSRGDGSHVFNKTLRAHNNDVIKYQLKGRRKSFSSMKMSKK